MKTIRTLSGKLQLVLVTALLTLAALTILPVLTKAGPGPDRPTKTYSRNTPGFDHVTFNSFTGVNEGPAPIGDERYFFNGKYTDAGSKYADPMPEVKNNDVLRLQVYVHNGADPALNTATGQPGVARNTKVRVALPQGFAADHQAKAYISADNAQPTTVEDTLNIGSALGEKFTLEYVPGSAKVVGNHINAQVADSIVGAGGALIGSEAIDGNVKGCFDEMIYVTLEVKVRMPAYTVDKVVRAEGQTKTDWADNKTINGGAKAEWKLTFKNTGTAQLTHVEMFDAVPQGMKIVPGSLKLTTGSYPNGLVLPDSAITQDGHTFKLDIGGYNPGILAYVTYTTVIDKPAADVCAPKTLVNKVYATPAGLGDKSTVWDEASVTVPGNTCAPVTPEKPVAEYSCSMLTLTTGTERTVTTHVTYQAKQAVLKTVTYNWGDSSQNLVTDKTTATYRYAQNGTYTVRATLLFSVNGKDVYAPENVNCTKAVTFTSPAQPGVTPTPSTPATLPNTGVGNVIGLFVGSVLAGVLGFRAVLGRRLARS